MPRPPVLEQPSESLAAQHQVAYNLLQFVCNGRTKVGSDEHTCLQRLGLYQECPFANIFAIPSLEDGGSFNHDCMIGVNKDLLWTMLSSAFDPKRGHPHKWTVTHHYGTQKLYIVFTWIPNNRSGESPFSVGYVAGSNDLSLIHI